MKFNDNFRVSDEGSIPDTYHKGIVHGGRGKHGLGRNDEKQEHAAYSQEPVSKRRFNFGILGMFVFILLLMLSVGQLFSDNPSGSVGSRVERGVYEIGWVNENGIYTGDSLKDLTSKRNLGSEFLQFASTWGAEFEYVFANFSLAKLDFSGTFLDGVISFFSWCANFLGNIVYLIYCIIGMIFSFIRFIFNFNYFVPFRL